VAGAMNHAQKRQVGLGRDDNFSRQVSHGALHPCVRHSHPRPIGTRVAVPFWVLSQPNGRISSMTSWR